MTATPTEQDIRIALCHGDGPALAKWLRAAIAQRDQLQQQAEIHAQEARTANATIHEIYQLCTGATGEPGNWHGAEPVRRIVNELREAKQALAEVRPEIDSLIKGLYRSHVNPSDGRVHDEDVAHELSQLTELHERIVRLIGDHQTETEDDKNRRYAGMLDRVRTAPSAMDESIDDILDEALADVHEGRGDAVRDELRRLRSVERVCEGEAYLHRKYYERADQLENELSDAKKQVADAEDRERELIAELGRLSSLPEKMRMEACARNVERDAKNLIFGFSGEIDRALAARKGGIDKLLDEMSADIDSMSDEEIRAESSPGDAEEMRRVIDSATAPHTPQAHGDALAALDEMSRYAEVGCTTTEHHKRVGQLHGRLRFYLTASGVPERGDVSLDQYEQVRRERDRLAAAIRSMPGPSSGVPYVPVSIQELPDKMRREANYVEPDRIRPEDSYSMAVDDMANMLESALASAPADGYRFVGYAEHGKDQEPGPGDNIIDSDEASDYVPECVTALYIDAAPQREHFGSMKRAILSTAPQRGGEHE